MLKIPVLAKSRYFLSDYLHKSGKKSIFAINCVKVLYNNTFMHLKIVYGD